MGEPGEHTAVPTDCEAPPSLVLAGLGGLGILAYGLALLAVQPIQFNVVTYSTISFDQVRYWPSLAIPIVVLVAIMALAGRAAPTPHSTGRRFAGAWLLWPLLLTSPLACYAFTDRLPPFALSWLMILAGGWAAFRVVSCSGPWTAHRRAHPLAVSSIVVLIGVLTVVHTQLQINFFEHFMLGHSDCGHFAEELKNALAGRGLRSDSFENTRLGWHFTPLLYVLVPGYALWPSPVYLMVCGALLIHIPALPAYFLARRLSGSVAVAWMFAAAWLLLPSSSRLVYANTYGFQWTYSMMPLLALMIAAGVTGRWRTCLVMVVLVLLCKETAAAATLGWGLYVALFTPRRKTGIVIALGSVAYFILCGMLLIPYFAAAGRYERLDMFGELGNSMGDLLVAVLYKPGLVLERLLRREVACSILVLLVPMALLPLRGWRIAAAALPTLLLVVLLQNEDWLSIKFWHHATVLPVLFFAGIAAMHKGAGGDEKPGKWAAWLSGDKLASASVVNRGMAAGLLVCAALGHYFYGFSPISKSYEPYTAATFLHRPDPRLETVKRLRADIAKDRTILATERLAAHFTDYKRLYTGRRIRSADFVVIDRADTWDTSGLPQKTVQFVTDPEYMPYGEFGSIMVFGRRSDVPQAPQD